MFDINKEVNEHLESKVAEYVAHIKILETSLKGQSVRIEELEFNSESERYKNLYFKARTQLEMMAPKVLKEEQDAAAISNMISNSYALKEEVKHLKNRLLKERRARKKMSSIKNMILGYYKKVKS